MEIIEKNINELKPYEKNPRRNDASVDYVANSIREFGWKQPIVIDKNGVIVAGHTRYKAAKKLHQKTVPCVIADGLTEEQIRAYRLADNKVGEASEWDFDLLDKELAEIMDIDMGDFGFDDALEALQDPLDAEGDEENERYRTNKEYNMHLSEWLEKTDDFWQMPIIHAEHEIPSRLISFNYALTSNTRETGIHFFIDDYQFERLWNEPEKYIDLLFEYDCILSPDFSLYLDMDEPLKIWNVYRSRLLGAYYQSKGIIVIPTLSWADEKSFEYCFKGIEKGSAVAVSTVGVQRDTEKGKIWRAGMDEAIKQIAPEQIILYGNDIDYDFGGIEVYRFENEITKKMENMI